MAASRTPARVLTLHVQSPPTYLCPLLQRPPSHPTTQRRPYASTSASTDYTPQQPRYPQDRPRWQQTPPRMVAPFRSKPPVKGNDFKVNEDPVKLDQVYGRILGEKGGQMLTEEVKWLAVTHKSFDHGRRGYNDRLSFLGRRIIEMQISISLISSSTGQRPLLVGAAHNAKARFEDPALQGLENLTEETKRAAMDSQRIARLGERYGLKNVIRWKPRKASDLQASGQSLVVQQALYAIIGAVALQKGGQVANNIVSTRILGPLEI